MDNELVLSGFPAIGWFHADDVTSMHQDREKLQLRGWSGSQPISPQVIDWKFFQPPSKHYILRPWAPYQIEMWSKSK